MEDEQIVGCNGFYARHTLKRFLDAQSRLKRSRLALYPLPAHLWLDHIRCVGLETLDVALERRDISVSSFHPQSFQYSLFEGTKTSQGRWTAAYYRRCVDTAAALGCSTLCIEPAGSLLDRSPQEQWRNLVEQVAGLCAYARQHGVQVCVQTVTRAESGLLRTLEELLRLLEEVPDACAVLDTVPASQAGESISLWFSALGEKIRHVRFRDGRTDGGRIWGEGVYPFHSYGAQLLEVPYTGTVSLCGVTDRYQDRPEEADTINLARAQGLLYTASGG